MKGPFVAITTPFTSDGIDVSALKAHASWMVDNGINGIVVCGTTGEAATMSVEEKILAMNSVVEAVGERVKVIGGAGSNSTAAALKEIKTIGENTNVDALMSVVPYYNKPSQRGILAHFRKIADLSPKPIVIYNVPGRTVVGMTVKTMSELASHSNIIGIKEASGNLVDAPLLFSAVAGKVAVFSGDDATAPAFIATGGDGVISVVGNAAPNLMATLCSAAALGDRKTLVQHLPRLVRLHKRMFSAPNPIPAKIAVSMLGFGSSMTRLPMVPLFSEEEQSYREAFRELGVTR